MSYQSWHTSHNIKHKKILDKLSNLTDDEVIDYFDYENMKEKENDFCVLYGQNKKCHNMKELNCYLCACPNFRVNSKESFCSIDSIDGSKIHGKDFNHQDCSKCTIPHTKAYVKKYFNRNWSIVMKDTF